MGVAEAIVLAFVGGMILNLMPCVLPVLAVKVTALASMGEHSGGQRLRHGLGYAAGIVASMLALAASVIALQMVGQSVGWGFQFQHPVFVVSLAAVMVLFALNLFGVFEIGIPSKAAQLGAPPKSGDRRSFFEGILAVVLATPCTAPFMGTAIGFAMTSHPLVIISVFVSLGLGLAAPFVAVALVPALYKVIPKPGNWMIMMKKSLGFALLLTALWLVWLFGRLMGPDAVTGLLGFLIALSFAAWLYGEVQYRPADKIKALALTVALVAAGGGGWAGLGLLATGEASSGADTPVTAQSDQFEFNEIEEYGEDGDEITWHPWSPETIAAGLENGRPVFVNFTADWCVTCKVNEREIISAKSVVDAARESRVLMVQADLTNTDDVLVSELERFNRSGVPLYLFYTPDAPDEPQVLPQVISRSRLIEAFSEVL